MKRHRHREKEFKKTETETQKEKMQECCAVLTYIRKMSLLSSSPATTASAAATTPPPPPLPFAIGGSGVPKLPERDSGRGEFSCEPPLRDCGRDPRADLAAGVPGAATSAASAEARCGRQCVRLLAGALDGGDTDEHCARVDAAEGRLEVHRAGGAQVAVDAEGGCVILGDGDADVALRTDRDGS